MTTENTPKFLPIPPNNQGKLYKKTQTALKLMDAGVAPKEALQITNCKKDISWEAVKSLKEKYRKHSLTEPSTVKLAYKQIRRILQAESRGVVQQKMSKDGQVVEFTEQIAPTDSNILAAAGMVYDRYEPVRGQESGTGQGNTYIDLSSYRVSLSTGSDNVPCDRQTLDMVKDK